MKIKRRFSAVERDDILKKSQECLWTKDGERGLEYLIKERQISENTIRLFHLGYIPKGVKHQLAGRIILPVYDPSNHLVSISSRSIDKESILPVYWHESYEKSWYLYGIENAKQSMEKWRFVVVVEGQFDVLQLHNHGMTNSVGISGTNLTDMHIAVIHRYCEEVILLLDRDSNFSGQKGISKVLHNQSKLSVPEQKDSYGEINTIMSLNYKIEPLSFEEDGDPDSFIRKNGISRLKYMIRSKVSELRSKNVY